MTTFDFHTHVFHPKVAGRILRAVKDKFSHDSAGTGLAEDLLVCLDRAGLDKGIVVNAAGTPKQVNFVNNWTLELSRTYKRIIPFGTVHPKYNEWEKELERLKQAGIPGIKLHPVYQKFRLDHPVILPMIQRYGTDFCWVVHLGRDAGGNYDGMGPADLMKIKEAVPQWNVVAAHLGGLQLWEEALEIFPGTGIPMDTASCLSSISDTLLEKMFAKFSLDQILFGSDYPFFNPSEELALLTKRTGLASSELKHICNNASSLLSSSFSL